MIQTMMLREERELIKTCINFERGIDRAKAKKNEELKRTSELVQYYALIQGLVGFLGGLVGVLGAASGALSDGSQQDAWISTLASGISTNASIVSQGVSGVYRGDETSASHKHQRETESVQSMGKARHQWDEASQQWNQLVSRMLQQAAESYQSASGRG